MTSSDDNLAGILDILRTIAGSQEHSGEALSKLSSILYQELHRLASLAMRNDSQKHSLQTTALIHEVFLKLAGGKPVQWESRAHFLGIAARAMRQVLVDQARSRNAAKRGGGWQQVTLSSKLSSKESESNLEMIALEAALQKLAAQNGRTARIAEMRIFSEMSSKEMAEVLDVSVRTVSNDWAMARMWLSRELRG